MGQVACLCFIDYVPEYREPHMFMMWGTFNGEYKHEIPKQLRVKGEDASRISLTFHRHTE